MNNFLEITAFDVTKKIVNNIKLFNNLSIKNAANIFASYYKDTHNKNLIFLGSEIAKDISIIYPEYINPDSICEYNIGAKKGLSLINFNNKDELISILINKTKMNHSQLEHSLCEFSKFVKREDYFNKNKKFLKNWIYVPSSLLLQEKELF